MNIGIDKLVLNVKGANRQDGQLSNVGWAKSNNYVQTDNGLILDKATFYASNLNDGFNGNLTIKDEPLKDTTSIMFNPTNFFSHYKLTTDVKGAMDKAQDIVWKSGLDLDLTNAQIVRIDVTKDRILSEPVQRYAPTLQNYLHFRRQSKNLGYQDGLTLGNNSRQFTFYDRKLKLDLDKVDNDLSNNTARLEYKLLNAGRKSWTSKYGIYTPKDLTNDADQYQEIYKDGLTNLVLKDVLDGDLVRLSPVTLIHQLEQYKEAYKRNAWGYFLKHYGVLALCNEIGFDALVDVCTHVTNSKRKDVTKKLKKDLSSAIKLGKSVSEVKKPVELVQEIFYQYAKAS